MKILFIAPIPLPINGQSKASKVLLDKLLYDGQDLKIVNLSKNSLKNGFNSLKRVFDIFCILVEVWKKRNKNDIIYLSLGESFFGNLRDLFIYGICYKSRHKIFIHMLGGAGMKKILEGKGVQKKINSYFINDIAGVIVEGSVNFEVFSNVISKNKIHIVPNFAEDFLFVNDEEIKAKFSDKHSIQILYLSNLIPGKGYDDLANAYIELEEASKKQVNIVFVGGFESQESEKDFMTKIKTHNGLNYIGKFIDGDKKRELYCQSQVFCLPTYYPFEGQPISILEAYATGCVVITTNHSGIPYIFNDKNNGFLVEKQSIQSIKNAIVEVLINRNNLFEIAKYNRDEAKSKYRTDIYQTEISKIFNAFYDNK
jgi:glycosyltransferase involved in cell wall biosynthesis